MSGERLSPLWPEGLRKKLTLPPLENQRTQAPSRGEPFVESKQGAADLTINNSAEPTLQGSDLGTESSRPASLEPNPPAAREKPRRTQRRLPRNPSEQRGEAEPFQPNPAVQQAAERLGKPPPEGTGSKAEPAQDPELRELARELWGEDQFGRGLNEEGVTSVMSRALEAYPKLPPDEALKRYDRAMKRAQRRMTGFSFS
jgi:hypothetical protein